MTITMARRITFSSSHEQFDNLRKLSDATGAPVSELVRRAVAAYLSKRHEEWSRERSDPSQPGEDGEHECAVAHSRDRRR